jgi:hypothetical protein
MRGRVRQHRALLPVGHQFAQNAMLIRAIQILCVDRERKRHAQPPIRLPQWTRRFDLFVAIEPRRDRRVVTPRQFAQHRLTRQRVRAIARQKILDHAPFERVARADRPVKPQHARRAGVGQRGVRELPLAGREDSREFCFSRHLNCLPNRPDRAVAANRAIAEVVPLVGEVKTLEWTLPGLAAQRLRQRAVMHYRRALACFARRRRRAAARVLQSGRPIRRVIAQKVRERYRHVAEHHELARPRAQPRDQVRAPAIGRVDCDDHIRCDLAEQAA